MGKNRKIKETSPPSSGGRWREVGGIVALGTGVFLLLALISLQAHGSLMGPFGRGMAKLIYGLAGVCSYAIVGVLLWTAFRSLLEREPVLAPTVAGGVALAIVAIGVLAHLAAADYRVAGTGPGGAIGEHVAEVLRGLISTVGTALLASVLLVVAVVIATPLRMRQVLGFLGHGIASGASAVWRGIKRAARFVADVAGAILPERDHDDYDAPVDDEDDVLELGEDDRKPTDPPIIVGKHAGGDTNRTEAAPPMPAKPKRTRKAKGTEEINESEPIVPAEVAVAALAAVEPKGKKKHATTEPGHAPAAAAAAATTAATAAAAAAPGPAAAAPAAAAAPGAAAGLPAPLIVEPRFRHADKATMAAKEKQADAERQTFIKLGEGDYQLPSIQLLNYDAGAQNTIDKTAMLELSARLTQTLENYSVKGDVVAIRPGPVVTMYEFAPAPGTRVNRIVNLTDDLALALEALRVRIVAPIPGKAAVGIEVPNKQREKVFLKEIIADDLFRKSKSKLPIALGKDIEGGPSVVDLARMPHLLVAGTTGSGKSVAVNAMITSLLYNCSPEDCRMIMVDPKMLELSIYEGVPHLLLPVVTDPKKANLALRWAVDEMERRYDLLAQAGVRDISTYNEKVLKAKAKLEADKLKEAAEAAARALETDVANATAAERDPGDPAQPELPLDRPVETALAHKLPYIVVVIDEFADLIMCAPKDVETSVARIAQKARAAGIHLILATQRPSVDVITGLIKANFPSRIAFSVASKIDSRTILDQTGAEALLGAGDMLFSDRGAAPVRLHGCFVDEDEIHRVVAFLKTQGRPVYNLEILKPRDEEGDGDVDFAGMGGNGKSEDDLYDKAVYVVTTTRNASISWVQRQLRIGYNRAARIVEEMEKQGVVSGPDHTNKREVLVAGA
jgi:S-DNA-T family DNA segregation ATPase FtsK/SpoIIIE